MALLSFVGRLLFVSVFVLAAYQEFSGFGDDGGVAVSTLRPKFKAFTGHFTAKTGLKFPHVDVGHLVLGAILLKGIGSLLFVFGSTFGALLLCLHQLISTPILYDFYNYDADKKEFAQLFLKFTENLALYGALLFFLGMKTTAPRRGASKKKTPKTKTY